MTLIEFTIYKDKKIETEKKPKKIHREVLYEGVINFEDKIINITPESLKNNLPKLKNKNIYGFNASINCTNAVINIAGFKYFSLGSFLDTSPSISSFKVSNIEDFFRLNDLKIHRLDVSEASLLLVDSDVNEINIGINSVFGKNINELDLQDIKITKTDFRGSSVKRARIFVPNGSLNIQRTNINYFSLEVAAKETGSLRIWENSFIERIKLYGLIEKFDIWNSNVDDMEFDDNSIVNSMNKKAAIVQRIHNCKKKNMKEKSIDTWQFIMNSAKNSNYYKEYTDASYNYMCIKNKKEGSFSRFTSYLLRMTCGYGYKPLRTIITSFLIWLIFSILYWVCHIHDIGSLSVFNNQTNISNIDSFGYSLYFSIITFTTTGFGDITPTGISRLLSGIESIMGILILSLFIFALTKRYGNFN